LGDVEEIGAYIDQVEGNDSSLKPAVQLNLDGEVSIKIKKTVELVKGKKKKKLMHIYKESPVALTFYQIIYGKDLIFKRQVMAPMCSVFNLLQSCEQVLNEGSLGNIDALLGSGVVLFSFGELEELPEDIGQQELEDACDMLFYSINW
jgi:hypothetical protein